jgi:hypothetical protein
MEVTPANVHDSQMAIPLMNRAIIPLNEPLEASLSKEHRFVQPVI